MSAVIPPRLRLDLDGAARTAMLSDIAADLPFTQSGTGAVARTVLGKLRESISVWDFIPATEHAAIQAGTSTYDCTADILKAIASGAWNIIFPGGLYVVSSTLLITGTNVCLVGAGLRRPTLSFTDTFDGPAIAFRPATATDDVLKGNNGISGLSLEGNASTREGRWAIEIVKQEGFQLDNVLWRRFSFGARIAGGQLNRLRRFTGQGAGLESGAELDGSTHLRLEKAANASGFQPCYTVNLEDFYLSGGLNKGIKDVVDIRSVDGLNASNGYVALGSRSLLKLETDANNDVITAAAFNSVYFDGVSRSTGTPRGLYIPAAVAGRINATFGPGTFFGNYKQVCIYADDATNIRALRFNGATLAGAEERIGNIKGVTGSSGSRISFNGCDIRDANGGLTINGGRLLTIGGGTSFTDILGSNPFLSITGSFYQKMVSYTQAGNAVAASDTATVTARPTHQMQQSGTFTPQLRIGSTLLDNSFHSAQTGQYDLVGDRVFIDLTLTITGKNSLTGNIEIAGLPFSRGGSVNACLTVLHSSSALSSSVAVPGGDIVSGTSRVRMMKRASAGDTTLTDADITTSYSVKVSGSYKVA